MQKIPLILGLMLLAALTVWEAYGFLVTNDGVGYFASHPRRLLYAVAIGVGGGFLTLAFSRVSPVTLRTLRLAALGGFAACVTLFLTIFATRLVSFAPMVTEAGMWGWVIAGLVSLLAVAALVWFEFYSVWRRHEDVA